MDIVMYSRDADLESVIMGDYLTSMGLDFRQRQVDHDPSARRDWERLDGLVTPLVVIDETDIVRGMDRTRVDQILGMVGC